MHFLINIENICRTRHSSGPTNLTTQSQKKFSKSAYELDSISKGGRVDRSKSSSLHNLDKERTLLRSNTRNDRERERSHTHQLQNIEESHSASDNENDSDRGHNRRRTVAGGHRCGVSPVPHKSETIHHRVYKSSSKSKSNSPEIDETISNHELPFEAKRYMFEENYRPNRDQNSRSMSRDRSPTPLERPIRYGSEDRTLRRGEGDNKPPKGPPKPARNVDHHHHQHRGPSRFESSKINDQMNFELIFTLNFIFLYLNIFQRS